MWLTDDLKALNDLDDAAILRLAFEIITAQQDIIVAQASLLMVSLDLPNVKQVVLLSVVTRDGD